MQQLEQAPVDRGLADIDAFDSPRAKLVVLYLGATGRASVDELHEALAIRRIDLLSLLPGLVDRGHLVRDGDRFAVA